MADLAGTNLDPNVPENTGGFTVIPEGKYQVVIVGDRLVDTKARDGKILELKVQVIEGEHRGSTVIDRLNIINKSPVAQAIGQGQLKRICNLCGVNYPPANTEGLIGKPMVATIKTESFISNNSGNELQSNKIAGYNPVLTTSQTNKASADTW